MTRPLLTLLALLALAGCATARPIHGGGSAPPPPSSTCPYDTGGYPDGCDGAPTDGAFQNASFNTYARQSGQSWAVQHPQTWNVAGWDYPVGYSLSQAPGGVLVAPQSASQGGSASNTNLPYTDSKNGCSYVAVTPIPFSGGPGIICQGTLPTNGTGAYAGFAVIQGIDFSQNNCTQLGINVKTGQTIYIINNKFAKGPSCTLISRAGELLYVSGGNANYYVNQNVFNALYAIPTGTTVANTITMNTTGFFWFQYDAILNSNGRPINSSANSSGGATLKWSYVDGMDLNPQGPHAEVIGLFPGGTGYTIQTIPNQDILYSTILYGYNIASPAVLNSAVYVAFGGSRTAGLTQTNYTEATIDHNTFVANKTASGIYNGKALFDSSAAEVGVLTVTNNIFDPTGNFYCQEVDNASYLFNQPIPGVVVPVWPVQPYIDDGLSIGCGAAPCHDANAGNTLTVPQNPTRQYFNVGLGNALLDDNETTKTLVGHPHVIALVSGINGQAGVYTIDGPPQNSQARATALNVGWLVLSGVDSLIYSGNVSLITNTGSTLGSDINKLNGTCPGVRGP